MYLIDKIYDNCPHLKPKVHEKGHNKTLGLYIVLELKVKNIQTFLWPFGLAYWPLDPATLKK